MNTTTAQVSTRTGARHHAVVSGHAACGAGRGEILEDTLGVLDLARAKVACGRRACRVLLRAAADAWLEAEQYRPSRFREWALLAAQGAVEAMWTRVEREAYDRRTVEMRAQRAELLELAA